MVTKSFKKITLGLAALSTALFMGCMGSDINSPSKEAGYGSVSMNIATGAVNAASKSGLKKGETISLSKLIVTMISNASPADTVNDTISAGISQGFTSTTSQQSVDSIYVLKALRSWYITVKTLDTQDSVIHIKRDTVVSLLAGQTVVKSLTLTPRFVMYVANFFFPDSLSSTTGPDKQKMNVTRLIMKVGADTVVDSSRVGGFDDSTAYSIGYDYILVNTAKNVEITVIGNLVGSSIPGDSALFQKTDISVGGVAASTDDGQTVTLPYVGPVKGKVDMTITINKVGTYTITTTTPPASVPKNGQ